MKRYKYIHVLWHDDLKFNPNVVKMIQHENKYFNIDEHAFVTPHKRVYEAIREYPNVEKLPENFFLDSLLKRCTFLILHSIPIKERFKLLTLSSADCKRIVLRTWGHDFRDFQYDTHKPFKNHIKRIYYNMYLKKIEKFRLIGVANSIDMDSINQVLRSVPTMATLGYSYDPGRYEKLLQIRKNNLRKTSATLKVIVGHAALKSNNHIEILTQLGKYKDYNLLVSIPLAYPVGFDEYKQSVKEFAIKIFKDKVEFLEQFMSITQYAEYLAKADILILDGLTSYALGNISLALFFKKKLYLNSNGVIAKSMRDKGISIHSTEEIGQVSFDDFSNLAFDERYNNYVDEIPESEICEQWRIALGNLTNE